jgi:hypothetical protein
MEDTFKKTKEEIVSDFDILCLNETWISDKDTSNLDIEGYFSEHLSGNKSRNVTKDRYRGGLTVYFKNVYKKYIHVL